MTDQRAENKPTPPRQDIRISLSLPPDLAAEVKAIADEEATPLSVLIRRWIVERLRQARRPGA